MKIVSYVHAYVPYHNGGAETTLHDMNRTLVDAGHDVTVIIRERTGNKVRKPYEYEGVKVVEAEDKGTVVHAVVGSDLAFTHLACAPRMAAVTRKFKVPLGHLVHNDLDLTRNYISEGTEFIVYNTEWIRNKFAKQFGHIPNLIVRPPILAERYKTDKGKAVTLVNLYGRKGADVFYALAERMPDVSFLGVIGGYGKQEIRHDLPNVEIMDHTEDMREVYSKTKVILMPSRYESYGRVACEAAASGIPAIVSDTPGLREALGDAGTYLDPYDVDAWETALKATLAPRKYGALSKATLARSEALDKQSRDELDKFVLYCEQFAELYKKKR